MPQFYEHRSWVAHCCPAKEPCLEASLIASNDMVNQAILLRLQRRHVPISVCVLVNLHAQIHVMGCCIAQIQRAGDLLVRNKKVASKGMGCAMSTFSMGCPVHSDMILLRFALWYMISLACTSA